MKKEQNAWGNSSLFITIEGIDGSGKSTQIEALFRRFQESGRPCIKTREPGGTPLGDALRSMLLDPEMDMNAHTEMYLYAAARAEHVRKVIIPSLQQGISVISDRFVDASIAYQGFGLQDHGLSPEIVKKVNEDALAGVMPDLTVILDVNVDVAEGRLRQREQEQSQGKDRIERRGTVFYERVRQGLKTLYQENPQRFIWLDGSLSSVEDLAERIWQAVTQL